MRRILIILTVGLLSFGLGWLANDMCTFAGGVIEGLHRSDSATKQNNLLGDRLKVVKTNSSKKRTIRDYCTGKEFVRWAPQHLDTTNYMCEITLHEITALYWYHGQCAYDYFTYLTSDTTIDVLWSYRTDCILNMEFLESSNGIKKHPKRGDTFATIILKNDTTLKVKYNFPEWTMKINTITKDSLFPTYYFLKRDS